MKICMILEGCYPYTRGGVSSWVDQYIRALPQYEFLLWTVNDTADKRGKFKYDLPENVTGVHEVFLDDAMKLRSRKNNAFLFTRKEEEQISKLIRGEDPDWDILFGCYNSKGRNPVAFLMSEQFLRLLKQMCAETFQFTAFADLFYTVRSMFLPLIYLMGLPIPEADIYHTAATGYSGILGAMGAWKYNRPFVVTEHGIYTREREEEILRSDWVAPEFKDLWIRMFLMLSRCAYLRAHVVTSLYERSRETQMELGCPAEKGLVIRNGIAVERFVNIAAKQPDEYVDIGAIVRIAPIKDIKTMIYSFTELKHDVPNARLHILGDTDDEEYAAECRELAKRLAVADLFFVGSTDVVKYMEKLDFTILTSISESQPLAVIESLASGRPCVATDVGCCRELLEGGEGDSFGAAGICVSAMDRAGLKRAMARLCASQQLRQTMGEAGKQRVCAYYVHQRMIQSYLKAYERAVVRWRG